MTGPWEESLRELAEPTVPWGLPSYEELNSALATLKQVVSRVANEPGIAGLAGDAAVSKFQYAAGEIQQQIDYLSGPLKEQIDEANRIREQAREALAALPAGSLSGQQEGLVRGAAIGTTILLGPISFLAGEGAVSLANSWMSQQREAAAENALTTASDKLDQVEIASPPKFDAPSFEEPKPPKEEVKGGGEGGSTGGGGGRSGGRSVEQYPQWNPNPTVTNPGGNDSGEPRPEYHTLPLPTEIGPRPRGPIHSDLPIVDLDNIKPEPTPDGSIIGTPTLPGAIPSAPGGGLLGGSGGAGAGIGSGLGAGLIAGGGGAAALGSIARGSGAPGGSLFSGAGGTATSGAAGRSGGLLGKTAAAGSGLGARGVGGMGGAAGGGAPAQSTAKGAGMRAGGVGGGGSAGGAATGGGARGAGAGSRGVGGMGGPGSRSDRRDEASRGLGGPIAPRMEDDEEIGPRSENAQAGGRDE
ncbi:hypothetical protein [Microbacterium sp. BH-3-3-3]|uniref:hypothetical protein n=1 Tax=Microbacterium sp. BH-3-3-3 TaxID=1906742 RepID=UPI0011A07E96|nr:hypothetical protein [Microbacterium sp. BH-3-3-3]